ncbi:unnamed protein product [Caenorhabditis brenneri]
MAHRKVNYMKNNQSLKSKFLDAPRKDGVMIDSIENNLKNDKESLLSNVERGIKQLTVKRDDLGAKKELVEEEGNLCNVERGMNSWNVSSHHLEDDQKKCVEDEAIENVRDSEKDDEVMKDDGYVDSVSMDPVDVDTGSDHEDSEPSDDEVIISGRGRF